MGYYICSGKHLEALKYTCSALFGNSRNFEIALRKLAVAKLRANFETACAIQVRNCTARTSAQIRNGSLYSVETMVASSKHFFKPTINM